MDLGISSYSINKLQSQNTGAKNGIKTKNINGDTVSFGNCGQQQISYLENKTANEFFTGLNIKSPDKCQVLLSNKKIKDYVNLDYSYFSDRYNDEEDLKAISKTLDKLSADEIKYVTERTEERLHGNENGEALFSALALYASDKKAFEYIINTPYVKENVIYSSGYSKDKFQLVLNFPIRVVSNINYNSILVIEEGGRKNYNYTDYTKNSDAFKNNNAKSNQMYEYLSSQITQGNFQAYRGEKSTWIFDSVSIDDKLAKKIKFFVLLNPDSRKDKVYPNNNSYSEFCSKNFKNIYDTIIKKDKLTLAEAMVAAKYCPKNIVDEILRLINSACVEDSNFKPLTLDERFAKDWTKNGIINNDKRTTIVETVNVLGGNQAGYCPDSGQYEIILNANPKLMTFENAKYDKETDTFYVCCNISAASP